MNTTANISLLAFTVELKDGRAGEVSSDLIVLDYDTVRRCQCYGMDGPAILHRLYNAQGYRVLDIQGHRKKTVSVDLLELYQQTEPIPTE